jgi:hypothetical protein
MRDSKAVPQKGKPVPRGEWLSMEKAAKKSGMSKEWLYKRMREGTLPFAWSRPCPGKRNIDSANIEDWLRLIEIPAGTKPGDI